MKTNNIVLLGLIGAAIYYFYKKNKNTITPTGGGAMQQTEELIPSVIPGSYNMALPQSVVPINETGVPALINKDTGAAIVQTLDAAGKPVDIKYQVRYAIKGIPNII